MASPIPALADTHTWTDAAVGNSNWNDGGNWTPAGPPGSFDDVIIPTPAGGVGPVIVNVTSGVANATVGANGTTPQIQIPAGRDLHFNAGDLMNNGLIVVNSDGGSTAARIRFAAFAGDNLHTLSGTGTVLLQAGSQTIPTAVLPATIETSSSVLTQATGHTFRGIGRITASIINNGEIWADDYAAAPGGNTLELTTSSMTNNGTIGATSGGTLDVIGPYVISQGSTGVISVTDGGTVNLRNSITVSGGALQTKGTGIIITPSSASATRLTSVLNEGNYRINHNAFTFIDGTGFINNGSVDLRDTMSYLVTGALDGTGEMVLSGNGDLDTQTAVTVNHGSGHTIRGAGRISAEIVNEGVIEANGVLRLLSPGVTNDNEVRAASGGTLQVESQVTQHDATGRIIAQDGGIVKLMSTGRVIDGRLQSFGSGIIHAGDNTKLTNVVNQSTMHIRGHTSVGRVVVEGSSLTNDDVIIVNPLLQGGSFEIAFCCDPQMTLDGTGYIDLNHTNASLEVAAGTVLTNAAGHTIKGPGIIEGSGELVNQGVIWGGTIAGAVDIIRVSNRLSGTGNLQDVRFSGTHAPGNNGPGSVAAAGQYEFVTGGRLEIEVGGTLSGTEFDAISAHNVQLAGTLDVDLINGFAPSAGQSFPFLTYNGGIFGSFANELLPALPGGLFFDVAYNTGIISLEVEGILGDYNRNGLVDTADYVVWRKTFGQMGSGLVADGDRSGAIDAGDFDVWQNNFGQAAPGAGGGAPFETGVPEPASVVLTAMAALLLGTRFARSRRNLEIANGG